MGGTESKEGYRQQPRQNQKKPMTNEKVMEIMDRYPDAVIQYFQTNRDEIEKYIVKTFWEEDVELWLKGIRGRSPKEHLQIRKIDFLLQENTATNNTARYENKSLVVRRACHFVMDVHFGNRLLDSKRDDLAVVFSIGATPSEATGTQVICQATKEAGPAAKWNCAVVSTDATKKTMRLKINVPANAIVGRYSVSLQITSGTQKGREKNIHKDASIIVLFNPFSKDDTVYMENVSWRDEYAMNDEGFINVGNFGTRGEGIGKRRWDFAQFDEGVLDSVLLMVQNDSRMKEKPVKNLKKCNSPVFLSRLLAAMVNCNDDCGVLWGRWDGEYADGKKPTAWDSSADIIMEWRNNDFEPVKYGQCWVFSGILTTALRALGIPARSVTNFESAHDTDRNETIDIYIDKETWERNDDTSDSVWNFHVWNECYFRRPELPEGYGGWQAVDATPQEASDCVDTTIIGKTLMQCGPAPLKAIKEGDINVGYDTAFVFSEVNADKVYWFCDKDGQISVAPTVQKAAVGKFIGTKAVGKYETENIVLQYKYAEGSPEERRSFNKAYSLGTQEHAGEFKAEQKLVDSAFEVTVGEMKSAFVGDKLDTKIMVKNVSGKKQKASLNIVANSKRHTGKIHAVLKRSKHAFEIEDGKSVDFAFEVSHDEYMPSMVDNYVVNIVATVTSTQYGNTEVKELDTTLELPDCVEITAPKSIHGGEECSFDIVVTNNMPMKMTNVVLSISGRGTENHSIKIGEPLLPKQTYKVEKEKIFPRLGWRRVYGTVNLDCAEVKGMKEPFMIKVAM